MSTEHAIEECLERIDHTRALLESQLTELYGRVAECKAAGNDYSDYNLGSLAGHMMGMTIVTARLAGADDDNIKMLLNLTLKGES